MTTMRLLLSSAMNIFVVTGCATLADGGHRTSHFIKMYEGDWVGAFPTTGIYSDGSTLDSFNQVWLEVHNGSVHVFVYIPENQQWQEASREVNFAVRGDNAVFYSFNTGEHWEEAWTLTASNRTKDELLVEWGRVVKNMDLPTSNKYGSFGFSGAGVLYKHDK